MKITTIRLAVSILSISVGATVLWQLVERERSIEQSAPQTQAIAEYSAGVGIDPTRDSTMVELKRDGVSNAVPVSNEPNTCKWEVAYLAQKNGALVEAKKCVRADGGVPKHPYESYSNAALGSLAYSDALAAETLGMRLRESNQKAALSLVIRASALSGGDSMPIRQYSNAYPEPSYVDGEPVLRTIHTKYVLSVVSELLGDQDVGAGYWEQKIAETSPNPIETLVFLEGKAREIVGEMRRIQMEVIGESSIQGGDDA